MKSGTYSQSTVQAGSSDPSMLAAVTNCLNSSYQPSSVSQGSTLLSQKKLGVNFIVMSVFPLQLERPIQNISLIPYSYE